VHKEDIEPITLSFVEQLCQRQGVVKELSRDALEALREYDWPGNVRELQNVLERAFAFADRNTIGREDLTFLRVAEKKADLGIPVSFVGMSLADIEKAAVTQTLMSCGGNKAKAARVLEISEKGMYSKMKRFGIS